MFLFPGCEQRYRGATDLLAKTLIPVTLKGFSLIVGREVRALQIRRGQAQSARLKFAAHAHRGPGQRKDGRPDSRAATGFFKPVFECLPRHG